ncbi:hypothetical protein CDAR_200461 [Caerostris darwini]|uniref:Uncharacterized protein n=1 Tax=Caerostris darwini TaxID=1538125 RepID=A0AAV4SE63_9ARAC|nr:hypothetical protein CDAR_200461 [Caerostris darwini]
MHYTGSETQDEEDAGLRDLAVAFLTLYGGPGPAVVDHILSIVVPPGQNIAGRNLLHITLPSTKLGDAMRQKLPVNLGNSAW